MTQESELTPVFCLASSLTITDAVGVQQTMLDLLRSASVLTLDGSEVEQVDGAGVQLLAAFMKEAAERQIEIRWSGASDRLRAATVQLGLDNLLGLARTA